MTVSFLPELPLLGVVRAACWEYMLYNWKPAFGIGFPPYVVENARVDSECV